MQVDDVHDLLEALFANLLAGHQRVPLSLRHLEDVPQPLGNGVGRVAGVSWAGGHVQRHGEGSRVDVVEAGEGRLLGHSPAHQAKGPSERFAPVGQPVCG